MFLLISPDHFGDAVVTVTAHAALDLGVNCIDTAPFYACGRSVTLSAAKGLCQASARDLSP